MWTNTDTTTASSWYPYFTKFSSFSANNSSDIIVFACIVGPGILVHSIICIVKIVTELKNMKERQIKNDNLENNSKYSILLLNVWDFSKHHSQDIQDHMVKLFSQMKLIEEDDFRMEQQKKRSRSQTVLHLLRQVVGILIGIFLMLCTWTALVIVNFFLTGYISIASDFLFSSKSSSPFAIWISSWFPWSDYIAQKLPNLTIALMATLITLIWPKVANLNTQFERWDNPVTHLSVLVFRMFASNIGTLVVMVIQLYLQRDEHKLGDATCPEDTIFESILFVMLTTLLSEVLNPLISTATFLATNFVYVKQA